MSKMTRRQALQSGTVALAVPFAVSRVWADAHAITHTVTIRDFIFDPAALTIAAEDSVRFVNEGMAPHSATAETGLFDTGRLGRGETAAFKFPRAGTHNYFCSFHPDMRGSIVVI